MLRQSPPSRWLTALPPITVVATAGLAALAGCGSLANDATTPIECQEPSSELFEQRVLPLLADDHPSSCNQCHLSGIDLGAVVRETPCQSMACLLEEGLVDLASPEDSVILSWIRRAEPDSELITEEVIDLEYQAFLEWIELESECGSCASTSCPEPSENAPFCERAAEPDSSTDTTPYRDDCSDRAIEQLFLDTIYASRNRCYPCHFSGNNSVPEAPRWISQEGTCAEASLATMRNVVRDGYVDVDDPSQSLLLLKPLAETYGGVEHGGHHKFSPQNDPAYENFLAWLTHYATCQKPAALDE